MANAAQPGALEGARGRVSAGSLGAACGPSPAVLTAERVFRDYAERVVRLLLRLGAAPMDVDDLLQDVFLVVARAPDFDTSGPAKAMTWLTAITMRVMANYRRARHRQARRQAPLHDELPAPQAPPPELVYADQRRELLMRALDQLPAPQRDLIVLFELEGHDCAEIAELLGTKPSAVHSRLSRARKTLKKRFEELARQAPRAAQVGS